MRKKGAGRKTYYPEIDEALLEFFMQEREKNHTVTCDLEIILMDCNLEFPLPEGFQMSDKYFQNWLKRNKISYRRITHEGQADLQTMIEKQMLMKSYFEELKRKTQSLSGDKIIQMDETPYYLI